MPRGAESNLFILLEKIGCKALGRDACSIVSAKLCFSGTISDEVVLLEIPRCDGTSELNWN